MMMSMEAGGLLTTLLGALTAIIACALPIWRVTTYAGSNTMGPQMFSEGLWTTCVYENTGQMQCKSYDSMPQLSADIQTCRLMVVTALFVTLISFIIYFSGGNFSRRTNDNSFHSRFSMVSGALFVTAGSLILIPVSWTADNTMSNFYGSVTPEAGRRDLGSAIYIGFISSILLLIGGVIMCRSGSQFQQDSYPRKYRGVKTCDSVGYPMRDYV